MVSLGPTFLTHLVFPKEKGPCSASITPASRRKGALLPRRTLSCPRLSGRKFHFSAIAHHAAMALEFIVLLQHTKPSSENLYVHTLLPVLKALPPDHCMTGQKAQASCDLPREASLMTRSEVSAHLPGSFSFFSPSFPSFIAFITI